MAKAKPEEVKEVVEGPVIVMKGLGCTEIPANPIHEIEAVEPKQEDEA